MKITALEDHKCFCCPKIIKKGEECLVFMILPKNPEKEEFDLLYMCLECAKT